MIHCGDNLAVMRDMESGSVDLIATDPPYNTGKDFGAYNDAWGGLQGFLDFMRPRLVEMHRLLSDTGSLYLQCDCKASHYLKVELDKIFGLPNFRNEIVWCYTGPTVNSVKQFPRKHDAIFWYSKSCKDWVFNRGAVRVPYKDGLRGSNKRWGGTPESSAKQESMGKVIEDFWTDIGVASRSKIQWVGYPTQKPIRLYERIITASCPDDGLVFDPFAGSGTTLVAAKRLGRRYIGIDENPDAVMIAEKRLTEVLI